MIKNRELGSSPLTRGKQTSLRGDKTGLRLIPAHAGKTRRPRSSRAGGPAHPRSRGENSGMASRPRSTTGSSPLTRGKHVADLTRAAHGRLIPAHAGKTRRRPHQSRPRTAHPRSRGENGPDAPLGILRAGSSPLTRGKQAPTMIGRGPPRLIPAHAGKTAANWSATFLAAAHPRSRGENVREDTDRRCGHGLIPAHAGKTGGSGAMGVTRWAHPRSRGENETLTLRIGEREGSSPLTRGKRWYVFVDRFAVMAHPRSRGENPRRPRGATVRAGSSPLTRGKPSSCTLRPRTTRLIPAHAGKTAQIKPGKDLQRAHPRSRGENVPGPPGLVPTQRLIPAHAGKTAPG